MATQPETVKRVTPSDVARPAQTSPEKRRNVKLTQRWLTIGLLGLAMLFMTAATVAGQPALIPFEVPLDRPDRTPTSGLNSIVCSQDCESGLCGAAGECLPKEELPIDGSALNKSGSALSKSALRRLAEVLRIVVFLALSFGVILNIFVQTVGVIIMVLTSLPSLPSFDFSFISVKHRVAEVLGGIGRSSSGDRTREAGYDC